MRLFGVEPQLQRARGAAAKRKAKGPAIDEEDEPEEDRGAWHLPAKAPRPVASAAGGGSSQGQQSPPPVTAPILTGTPVPESRLALFRFPLVVRLAGIVMSPGGDGDGGGAVSPPGRTI
jgi:hypothetical protein